MRKSKEADRKYWREWCLKNKESRKKTQRKYYQSHKEKEAEKTRKWRSANKEKIAERVQKYNRQYHVAHRTEILEHQKKWRLENGKDYFVRHRYLKYNLTLEEADELLVKQDHKCPICKTPLLETKRVIDHDHKTNKVRGILCNSCNLGLGLFKEDPKILESAINYLREKSGHSQSKL